MATPSGLPGIAPLPYSRGPQYGNPFAGAVEEGIRAIDDPYSIANQVRQIEQNRPITQTADFKRLKQLYKQPRDIALREASMSDTFRMPVTGRRVPVGTKRADRLREQYAAEDAAYNAGMLNLYSAAAQARQNALALGSDEYTKRLAAKAAAVVPGIEAASWARQADIQKQIADAKLGEDIRQNAAAMAAEDIGKMQHFYPTFGGQSQWVQDEAKRQAAERLRSTAETGRRWSADDLQEVSRQADLIGADVNQRDIGRALTALGPRFGQAGPLTQDQIREVLNYASQLGTTRRYTGTIGGETVTPDEFQRLWKSGVLTAAPQNYNWWERLLEFGLPVTGYTGRQVFRDPNTGEVYFSKGLDPYTYPF